MKKEKKIYVNKINKKIGNNQNYYDIAFNNEKDCTNAIQNTSQSNELSISKKISELFNTNGYIFNINVKIITDSKTYDTKIAGKVGNYIVTLDNEIIPIDDIKDIIF